MPLPQPVYYPPFNITRSSHVIMTSRDLEASRAFYEQVVGLVVSDCDADTLYFRGLEEVCHHSLVIKRRSQARPPSLCGGVSRSRSPACRLGRPLDCR